MYGSIRYASGLGSNEVYARIINNGTFWDFSTRSWGVPETQTCRVFLVESTTNDPEYSWYTGSLEVPAGGIFPVEMVRISTGEIIGNDVTQSETTGTTPKSIYESVTYNKGLGNSEVYARMLSGSRFWDFQNKAWSDMETTTCRIFLTEFDTGTTGWYYSVITPPFGGPYPVEVVRLSTGEVIGNDIAWGDTSGSSALPARGTVQCIDIITTVARQLQDILNITWPSAVLLNYLNYAVREIINIKSEAGAVTDNIEMVQGTRQSLPTGWLALIDVKRNMGADGITPGQAIIQIPKQTIDNALPDWHSWSGDTVARYVIFDPRDPLFFDVFPPQPNGTSQKIEAIGVKYPDKATDPANDPFPLPDDYEVPAMNYMLHMALNESTTVPNAINKATAVLQKFHQYFGTKNQSEVKDQAQGV